MQKTKIFILIFAALLLLFPLAVVAQTLSASFQHSIQVGYDGRACAPALAGAIRYNSATSTMQLCRLTPSAAWVGWGG